MAFAPPVPVGAGGLLLAPLAPEVVGAGVTPVPLVPLVKPAKAGFIVVVGAPLLQPTAEKINATATWEKPTRTAPVLRKSNTMPPTSISRRVAVHPLGVSQHPTFVYRCAHAASMDNMQISKALARSGLGKII
jgi:hypothetical protein